MSDFVNTFFDFGAMRDALPRLLSVGLPNTLLLAVGGFVGAVVIGMVLTLNLVSSNRVLRLPGLVYVDLWRGLPTILSILVIGRGLPLAGVDIFGRNTYAYAIAALAIVNGAFVAEIFRSGIQSVDRGQAEAARSLGLSYFETMWRIVIPQGLRRVMPALMNQFIICLKESALVYLLGLVADQQELFNIGQTSSAYSGSYSVLTAAAAIYLVITVPLTHLVNRWDARLRSGGRRSRKAAKGGLDTAVLAADGG